MALTKTGLSLVFLTTALAGCVEGAATNPWEVTALNGDKMVGCMAVDVHPDMPGYYDLSQLPDFSYETFKALKVDLKASCRLDTKRVFLVDMDKYVSMSRPDPESLRRKCTAHPPPTDTHFYRLSTIAGSGVTRVKYHLHERDGRMVFVDAYTLHVR